MEKLKRSLSSSGPLVMMVGFIFVFVGERLLESTAYRPPIDSLGAALILGAWGKSFTDLIRTPTTHRLLFGMRFLLEGVAIAGLGIYGAAAQWGSPQSPVSLIGFALILFAFITSLCLEWVLPSIRQSQFVEQIKIKNAILGGASLATLLIGCASLNLLAHRHSYQHDFSFGAPTSPSEATLSLVQSGDKKVEVYVFLPKNNEIVLEIQPYLDALESAGATVNVQDSVGDPILSKELKVSTNGNIAFRYGKQSTKWFLGTNLNSARPRIKKLDHHIRNQLATIIREPSILYFTSGHGERQALAAVKGEKPSGSFFRKLIKELNNEIKELGITDGLERKIPADATALIVFGPTSPLSGGSIEAIKSYYQKGGHLLIMADPEANHGLDTLLASLGLELSKDRLCNETIHLRQSYTPADRCLIATNQFTNHPIMGSLRSAGGRTAVVMSSPGHLHKAPKIPPTQKQSTILRGMPQSFLDSTANYAFDSSTETKLLGNLGVAIEWLASGNDAPSGPGRAMIFSDSDLFADNFIGNRANLILAQNILGWVIGDSAIHGEPDKSEDIPIRHSKNEDIFWFYSTTFGAPSLILFGGIGIVRRRRKRKEQS